MEEDIKNIEFENPYLQVVWEDAAENFTQERIKSVKQYFSKKYSTLNVNIITKTKQTQATPMKDTKTTKPVFREP